MQPHSRFAQGHGFGNAELPTSPSVISPGVIPESSVISTGAVRLYRTAQRRETPAFASTLGEYPNSANNACRSGILVWRSGHPAASIFAVINPVTVLEIVWLLRSFFKQSSLQIAAHLDRSEDSQLSRTTNN